ncbi:hypothetical protein B0I35DRAFT_142396 [Stachybotrys elegans]|uniref:proline--tRNA ligase n=1 Tax=Stachybotrys elegans TaxID=80388 RepID=A0A8K0SZS3_9HYPO|nr:hypothetical protein B0I35DRAFT_142396 [Stachybotrys elegans]
MAPQFQAAAAATFCYTARLTQVRWFSQSPWRNSRPARSMLSSMWIPPTGSISSTDQETGHDKLVRGGFLRQSHSGIFQVLPMGLRVQDKIEKLLDKHMQSIGASRVSLSTITSEELWQKSDRLNLVSSELFRFTDRKEVPLMLSPTHEEEITSLVASTTTSYKSLPLKLYQITRKYRDERRPRHGLLRSREFIMKDLYTYDLTLENALKTYRQVAGAYRAFFEELNIPILVAEASSGDMGGDHSHEYHLANPIGEDIVVNCDTCGYTANDEVAEARPSAIPNAANSPADFLVWRGVTHDRKTLVNAWYPRMGGTASDSRVNLHVLKALVPELDASVNDGLQAWVEAQQTKSEDAKPRVLNVVDSRLSALFSEVQNDLPIIPSESLATGIEQTTVAEEAGDSLNLLLPSDGDGCPKCKEGSLKLHRSLELGHTFHLGTRYTEPLEAYITLPEAPNVPVPMQMGCYGIGLSRIFGAIAEHTADDRGLKWPRAIAPFDVVMVPISSGDQEGGPSKEELDLYDAISNADTGLDVVLDDRKHRFGWKMRDADLTGYPVIVVLGKEWRSNRVCEVQCRALAVKENIAAAEVPRFVQKLLSKL